QAVRAGPWRVCGYTSRGQSALCGSSHRQGWLWVVALPVGIGWWTRASEAGGRARRRRTVDLESGRRTFSRGGADRGSLSCQRTRVGRGPCGLWTRHSSGKGLGHARLLAARTGQSEALVCAIEALPSIPPEPGQARSIPERAVDYFTTNAQRMRYPLFRAEGMHIGSGIAEAACKTIVSTRAKRCGMRWTPEGLDALLPLR